VSEWQPSSSAPMEEWVLGYWVPDSNWPDNESEYMVCRKIRGIWYGSNDDDVIAPDFWQPLPQPPEAP